MSAAEVKLQLFTLFGMMLYVCGLNVEPQSHIIRNENNNDGLGNYTFVVETSDNFVHQQTGETKNSGTPNEALSVQGYYSYLGIDGKLYSVSYIADENGFRPQGEHLPQLPVTQPIVTESPLPVVPEIPIVGAPPALLATLAGGGLGK